MSGPNFDLYAEAMKRLPGIDVQASGGIGSVCDLKALKTSGAIVGRALWEGKIALEEALSLARV
jgi:phosphoribosylformimino-5-aminoimidazole carboxamide ribotide isomerase